MVSSARLLGLAFAFALSAATAAAATQKQIDEAIAKGVEYLKERYKNGTPVGGAHGVGPTALAGLAILEAGGSADDPAVKAITAAVRDASYTLTDTYRIALCILYLDKYGDKADMPLIQMLGVRLLAGQNGNGGWGYECISSVSGSDEKRLRSSLRVNELTSGLAPKPKPPGKIGFDNPPPADAPAAGKAPKGSMLHAEVDRYSNLLMAERRQNGDDNSNTQFGILGVWVARRNGVHAEAALGLIEKRFLASQNPQSGGWAYHPGGGDGSPSMTCAGLIGLATAVGRREERHLKADGIRNEKEQAKGAAKPDPKNAHDPFYNPPPRADAEKTQPVKPGINPPKKRDARDAAVQLGLANLGAALVGGAPKGDQMPKMHRFGRMGTNDSYFWWSLERVGVIYGLEKIAGVDWYKLGADALIPTQSAKGSWPGGGYDTDVNTAFALLVLTKSNVARDLSSTIHAEATELRSGIATSPPIAVAVPKAAMPDIALPVETAKPITPMPVEEIASTIASGLIAARDADWAKALEQVRDAKGSDYTKALVQAIAKIDGDRKKQAREALATRLTRMTAVTIRAMLKSDDVELRRAAALACAMKEDRAFVPDLIDRLNDKEEAVARTARAGLKSLSGLDFGPEAGSTPAQHDQAVAAWRVWWDKNK